MRRNSVIAHARKTSAAKKVFRHTRRPLPDVPQLSAHAPSHCACPEAKLLKIRAPANPELRENDFAMLEKIFEITHALLLRF